MNCCEPSSPLERGPVLGLPIRLNSQELSWPPILNVLPIAPPLSVRGQASGFPIEIDSRGSAPSPLADPQTITQQVSPKATQASRADWVPPGLVGLHPQDPGGASPLYQHCPTPLLDPNPLFPPQATPKWRRPASSSRGSLASPVACHPFEVAKLLLNHLLLLLISNQAVIDKPWTLLPAPRPQNLKSAVSDEDNLESSSSQHTASSNQSYPFVHQPRVASPDPPGFYDVDEFHLLRDHQINSLLSC
ncbi:hypothetical protein PGT21_013505 [Puccinia graminis f. sp. tritici]|uniref:Uncharacterized protein n=1 Tax=Puccinia graminis f. sp. tritici TaxID=56615 RepID=A0A5B0MUL9_PUCGR|nr:hypothetical protein PGT21_013505 [Puccinia graminis f. sp. tritici]